MVKIKSAAETNLSTADTTSPVLVVREYDEKKHKEAVEEMERRCEVVQPGDAALVSDLMGNPMARVQSYMSHVMLVGEYGREIVGVIRGCIKVVTSGTTRSTNELPTYVKLAYILGLRVSPTHRRLGIATKLVQELETWCKQNGAEFAYMATERTNHPCLSLFTKKFNYSKFRNPTVLVQPVHLHYKRLPSDITIIRIPPQLACTIYRRVFSNSEFFPKDIDALISSNLNLGTFMALPKKSLSSWNTETEGLPSSYAILSIWDTKEVYKLQVKGVSGLKHVACLATRVLDAMVPWLKIPSVPNVFRKFGYYFLYGMHMEGKDGSRLMKSLCKYAHNMGRNDVDCKLLVAEVGQMDPVRYAIPHWKKFSWDEDIWCIKKLEDNSDNDDWAKSSSVSCQVIFVDPRDL